MEAEPATPLVQLEEVRKQFRTGTLALEGLSLNIMPGEFVSLLGPSGCGKSTALRIISGLDSPSGGHVRRAWSTTEQRREAPVACVFQSPTLLPWSSAWNNVYLPLRLEGVSRKQAKPRVEMALDRVGLGDFTKAYPRQLSGGMQMRVAVARAMVTRPRLLLLDEPFAALDEITRFRLNDDLLSLWSGRGFAALFVTHSVYESVFLSSRVLVMSERPGRVIADIAVDLPRPRTEAMRSSRRYLELCSQASEALHKAVHSGEASPA